MAAALWLIVPTVAQKKRSQGLIVSLLSQPEIIGRHALD
jgi:hypothetical protein